METLDGTLHFPHMASYDALVVQRETIYTKFPFAIMEAKNINDVQKSVLFARKWNMLVSVKTSGHDFIGRSTAHGSLMIYLGSMNGTKVNLSSTRNPAGEITCESGNTWLKVYNEVKIYYNKRLQLKGYTCLYVRGRTNGNYPHVARLYGCELKKPV